jgi:dTDP-4-dehydrorhamnose reductase
VKVLVTGVGGQVGRALVRHAPAGVDLVVTDRASLDLADPRAIAAAVGRHRPDVVVNAAAYTAVDRAEADPDTARVVNAEAPAAFAAACAAMRATLVQVSTDFVFDGRQGSPYAPEDAPNPLGVYARTKLAGERAVSSAEGLRWFIVRTAWVYAADGRNFVGTILRLLRERGVASVVADQIGTPTSAESIARALWAVAADAGAPAILHHTDAGVASWYDFAVAIGEEATAAGLLAPGWSVVPIETRDYPTPARRPACSVLDKTATWSRLRIRPEHWRVELRGIIGELARNRTAPT